MYWKDCRWKDKRTVEPTLEPVTPDDMQQQCRTDTDEEDTLLRSYIKAARELLEVDTQRAFVLQTWQLKLDRFPSDVIELRRCPVVAVSNITYVDENGATQTLSASVYSVDTTSEPGRITLAYNQSWPATRIQDNAIIVTFTAGYGSAAETAAAATPEMAKHCIRLLAAHSFNEREAIASGTMNPIPFGYDSYRDRLLWAGYL